ncbi:ATP-binding cassette domain-containing protein [Naumannella sp. ID2617S]|nr:ATP-binding cassette domain-containing protein [Naumannella sp. ID2617S]
MSPTQVPAEVLSLTDVRVSLGGTEVLSSVSARLYAGEAVALMGANGSGKSTLVRALLGLVPHRGSVHLFGTPQARFREWSKVGYVPQRSAPSLQGATVREVVASGRLAHRRPLLPLRAADRGLVEQSIDRVGLSDRAGMELGELSGGQQQRALIARALAGAPRLMVLDEPMAGIDLPTQTELTAVLAGLKRDGLAMLVVLHDLGPLDRLMDRAWVLRSGRLIYDGAPRAAEHDHHDAHCEDPERVPELSLVDGPTEREWQR